MINHRAACLEAELSELEGENCGIESVAGACDRDCHQRRFKTKLIALAMPTLDQVRAFRKYDIGAIFINDTVNKEKAAALLWKYVVDVCLHENAAVGNANAKEDSPLGVAFCERIGLVKAAKNCRYRK